MKFHLVILALIAALAAHAQMPAAISYPAPEGSGMTVSQFYAATRHQPREFIDSLITDRVLHGDVPQSLRHWALISDTLADATGAMHSVTFAVSPDVLAIGSDSDYLRVPMLPATATRIADMLDALLPTRKISNLIHKHSAVKLTPHPMTPDSTMITMRIFIRHDSIVKSQMAEQNASLGMLIAGHKKDVVITNRIDSLPDRVHIYGWHYPDGKNIQPLYSGHTLPHVDYSHGIRLVSRDLLIDGVPRRLDDILADPVLYAIFSDESEPMTRCRYFY